MEEFLVKTYIIGAIISFAIYFKHTFFVSTVFDKSPLAKYTVGPILVIYNALMWPIRLIEYMSEQIYRPGI